MRKKLFYIIFSLFVFSVFDCQSQRKLPVTVTLDTKTWQISEADKLKIPFDEPFNISGTFDESRKIASVVLKYRLKNHCIENTVKDNNNCLAYYKHHKHYYLYDVDENLRINEGYVHLEKVEMNPGSNSFTIKMDPLHPNLDYEFKFEFLEFSGINKDKQEELKSEIFSLTNDTFDFKKDQIDQDDFKDDLKKILKSATNNNKVFDKNGNEIDFSNPIESNGLNDAIKSLVEINNEIYLILNDRLQYKTPINSRYTMESFVDEIDKNKSSIVTAITTVLNDKKLKNTINLPVNALVSEKIKLKTALEFILFDLNRWKKNDIKNVDKTISESYILEILKGRAKKNNIISSASALPDLESGQLLLSTFIRLKNLKSGGKIVIKKSVLNYIINYLEAWVNEITDMNNHIKALTNSKKDIPNLYEDIYNKFNITNQISTLETLSSEKSNYIGLDIGYIVAPNINSSFIFEGFNFHFRPVNKRVDFSKLRGRDEFFKRFSIAVGIAQRVGSYNDNYKTLIGNIGSPVLGIGFRPLKWCRLSSGIMFYEVEDSNPLIAETSVKSTLFLSVSLDIAFRDMIRKLAGL